MSTKTAVRVLLLKRSEADATSVHYLVSSQHPKIALNLAGSIDEGIERYREARPDIVLVEYPWPGVANPFEPFCVETPVLALVVHHEPEDLEKLLEMGAFDVLAREGSGLVALPWAIRRTVREWRLREDYQRLETRLDGLVKQESEARVTKGDAQADALDGNDFFMLSPEMMVIAGADGYFTNANPRFLKEMGYTLEELRSKPFIDFVLEEDKQRTIQETMHLASGGSTVQFVNRWLRANGEVTWMEWDAVSYKHETILAIVRDISELKRRDFEFHLSRFIIEKASEAILIFDESGKIVNVNKTASKSLGFHKDDLLGKFLWDIEARQLGSWKDRWKRLTEEGAVHLQTWHRTVSGRIFPVDVAINHVNFQGADFGCAFVRDMTAHKQAEQELQESEELFRQLAEHIYEVFWLHDWTENKTLYLSPAFETIWGFPVKEALAKEVKLFHYIVDEDRERVRRGFYEKAESGDYDMTYRILRPDGEVRWIRDRGFPIRDASGSIYRIAGVAEDITREKSTEDQRVQLEAQLRQVQRMEAIGQLTGGIAHDFNNILACVLGYTDLALEMLNRDPKNKITKYLEEVFKAGERARELIAQMLLFSRGGKGDAKPLRLQEVAAETLTMLKSMIPATIEIEFDADEDTPAVQMDPVQFQQLFMNLCVNGSAAMDVHGRLMIGVRQRELVREQCSSCHGPVSGRYVEVSVRDTGKGIADSVLEKIFEPFFTTKEVGKGTGMGLSVVHGVTHEHRGHILVETSPEGSCFRVLFQLAEGSAESDVLLSKETEAALKAGAGRWILVVDDEDAIANLLGDIFKSWGFKVAAFTESTAALEHFRETPEIFKLVVTDQTMPKITGVELSQEIMKVNPEAPVILCTGYSELIDEAGSQAENIKGYLHKPIEIHKLSKLVKTLLP